MNELKLYLSNCSRCKIKTPHIISGLRKLKGVKLRCTVCGNFRKFYTKVNQLVEYTETKSKELKNEV